MRVENDEFILFTTPQKSLKVSKEGRVVFKDKEELFHLVKNKYYSSGKMIGEHWYISEQYFKEVSKQQSYTKAKYACRYMYLPSTFYEVDRIEMNLED